MIHAGKCFIQNADNVAPRRATCQNWVIFLSFLPCVPRGTGRYTACDFFLIIARRTTASACHADRTRPGVTQTTLRPQLHRRSSTRSTHPLMRHCVASGDMERAVSGHCQIRTIWSRVFFVDLLVEKVTLVERLTVRLKPQAHRTEFSRARRRGVD